MPDISSTQTLNAESFIDNLAGTLSQSNAEDKKISKSQVRIYKRHMDDKRQERIKNLSDQLKGASSHSGGCFKILKVVFKIVDFLTKPISLLTMNQLKVDLSKTLDMLKDAKNQKKLLGLGINEQEILKIMDSLKKTLGDNTTRLKAQEQQSHQDLETVLRILADIESTFKHIQTPTK